MTARPILGRGIGSLPLTEIVHLGTHLLQYVYIQVLYVVYKFCM